MNPLRSSPWLSRIFEASGVSPGSRCAARTGRLLALICLTTLISSSANATDLPVQGGPGGSYFRSDCSGDYVVGVYVRSGAWIDAVGLKCAPLLANEGRFKHPAWNKPYHGGEGGALQPAGICPSDRYVSGVKFGYTREGSDPLYVDYVELTCTPIARAEPPNKVCLQTGHGCWDDPPSKPGGVMAPFSGDPFSQSCPSGEAAIGLHGRSGRFVDGLGLICGPKPVATAAPKPKKALGKRKTSTATPEVPPTPNTTTCTVKIATDIFNAPHGVGKQPGFLREDTQGVVLIERQGSWHHVRWPTGEGWVYSGAGHESLECA